MKEIDEQVLVNAQHRFGSGGEPPMTTLEHRVIKLESDVADVKEDIHELRLEMKEGLGQVQIELHKALTSQTKWFIGALLGTVAMSLTIIKLFF